MFFEHGHNFQTGNRFKILIDDKNFPVVDWKFFLIKNLLRPPLLGFEMRGDVIFSQSGADCPVILCPVIPHATVIGLNSGLK